MKAREMKPGIHWVGAVDWDRRLFDELIPLPDGTSYNAYLIKGSDKTALLDTVDPPMRNVLLSRLDDLGIKSIDYVVTHHGEQDHSGTLPVVLEKYPEAKVVFIGPCVARIGEMNDPTTRQSVQSFVDIGMVFNRIDFCHGSISVYDDYRFAFSDFVKQLAQVVFRCRYISYLHIAIIAIWCFFDKWVRYFPIEQRPKPEASADVWF